MSVCAKDCGTVQSCCGTLQSLNDPDVKCSLKADMEGDRKNAWNHTKDHKHATVDQCNAIMKPWESIPSRTPDTDGHDINKLLDKWCEEDKKKNKKKHQNDVRPDNCEPSYLWSACVLLELWNNSKYLPSNKNDEDSVTVKLCNIAKNCKKQQNEEHAESKASKKTKANDEYATGGATKNAIGEAKFMQAKAATDFGQVQEANDGSQNGARHSPPTQSFEEHLCSKHGKQCLLQASAWQLIAFMEMDTTAEIAATQAKEEANNN